MKIGRHHLLLAIHFAPALPNHSVSGFIGTSKSTKTGLRIVTRRQMTIQEHGSISQSNNSHEKKIIRVLESIQQGKKIIDWNDRMNLQSQWTMAEKGWNVQVEWKATEYGVGLFAGEDIPAETIMRRGIFGYNLFEVQNVNDIERFCGAGDETSSSSNHDEYKARLRYVSDYLWGFDPNADQRGYPINSSSTMENWFFGFWIPGNALNHNNDPTMVYRSWTTTFEDVKQKNAAGINVVALRDITKGEQIFDDYRRHGVAPQWLREFALSKSNMTLNFAECNDFVVASLPKND